MLLQISESAMHRVRWMLTLGWILLVASLFYDPISPWLTDSARSFSPFRLNLETCISVQGKCLEPHPYLLVPPFWDWERFSGTVDRSPQSPD